jgi:hypothetical protein
MRSSAHATSPFAYLSKVWLRTIGRPLSRLPIPLASDGNKKFRPVLASGALALLLIATPGVFAQTATTGDLRGTVRDISGALIPNAEIIVTNQATGESRKVISGSDGAYVVPLLQPGKYRVEIAPAGFERDIHESVVVLVTETTVVNGKLKAGSVATTVEVEDKAPLVDTSNNSLGDVVDSEQVQSLPLVNRNFTQIIDLSAGVTSAVTRADELGRGSGGVVPETEGGGINVQGARASDNNFQLNGVNVNDFGGSGLGIPIPNPDTIQEFRVQTGMYDAEYGRVAGANVDVVTKTGANAFHGDVFEFWRNDVLNANDYFFKEDGAARPELKQNQYGGTLGGPAVKDKLLFFTSYQGTRQINAVQGRQTFLSPLFTDSDRTAPGIGSLFAGQRGYFQNAFGGVGPAIDPSGSNVNPVALALLQLKLANGNYLYPSPNPTTGLVSVSAPASFYENQYMGNFEYIQSQKDTVEGRFFVAKSNQNNQFPTGGGNLPGVPQLTNQEYLTASLSDDFAISNNLFNQIRFGYARSISNIVPMSPFTFSSVGITSAAQNNNLPEIAVAGSDVIDSGAYSPYLQNNFDLEDNFSWVKGRHSMRFGAGVTRSQQANNGENYNGEVDFQTWPDFVLGLNGYDNGTAAAVGLPFSNVYFSFDLLGELSADTRTWDIDGYFQDDYKVTPRLTVNAGFRYEWLPPFSALHGRATNLNPALIDPNPAASGSYAGFTAPSDFPGTLPAGVTRTGINSFIPGSSNNTFAPRVGLAYSVLPNSDRLVLRAGYGIYYSAVTGNSEFQSVPSLPWADLRIYTPPYNGGSSFQDPFEEPIPSLSAFPFYEPYSPSSDIDFIATQQSARPGITQEYTLNLQQELSSSLLLQVAYVGSGANHLIYSHSINQAGDATPQNPIRGQTSNTIANLTLRVPYEGFDPAQFLEQVSEGRSNYNALEVTVKKNMSHGLQFLAAYTWSKTMTTGASSVVGSTFGGGSVGDQNNLYADYGPADFSRPQRFILSGIYKLPGLHEGPSLAKLMTNGWQAQGVATFQSGTPLTFTNSDSSNVFGITADHAYYNNTLPGCANVLLPGGVKSRLNEFFNTSCFSQPPVISPDGVGTGFGNTRAGMLQGPGQHNFDLALDKVTAIAGKENLNLEFRAEFFNAFNSSQFANPDTAYSDGAAFGVITATSVAPRIGQLALKLHF